MGYSLSIDRLCVFQLAVFPFAVFAVIVQAPSDTPVILPFETVAIDGTFELQVTFLLVAFDGEIAAVIVLLSPTPMVNCVVFNEIPVAGILEDTDIIHIIEPVAQFDLNTQEAALITDFRKLSARQKASVQAVLNGYLEP